MMYVFDADGSGSIDYRELRRMLKALGGHKMYSRDQIMYKKKNKGKKKKKKNKGLKGLLKEFF